MPQEMRMAGSLITYSECTATSILFGRGMEISIKYSQSVMVVVFGKDNDYSRSVHLNAFYLYKT